MWCLNAGDQPTYQIEIENNVNIGQIQLVYSRIGNSIPETIR